MTSAITQGCGAYAAYSDIDILGHRLRARGGERMIRVGESSTKPCTREMMDDNERVLLLPFPSHRPPRTRRVLLRACTASSRARPLRPRGCNQRRRRPSRGRWTSAPAPRGRHAHKGRVRGGSERWRPARMCIEGTSRTPGVRLRKIDSRNVGR